MERFILKVQGWADADKVTLLFPRKSSACCKRIFSMNKSIFHKGWQHWSILQLYFIWPHSHPSLPSDGFISCYKQWTWLSFIQHQVFVCVCVCVWTSCMLRLGLYSGPVTWAKIKVLALLHQFWAAGGKWMMDKWTQLNPQPWTCDSAPHMVERNLQVGLDWKHQHKEVAQSRLLISHLQDVAIKGINWDS